MAFTMSEIQRIYEERAPHYDVTANLYYVAGFREVAYRKRAIRELDLKPGHTVVELCCGTGLNFPLIENEIGPSGHLIGVDMTEGMLQKARTRIAGEGWNNIQLIHQDACTFEFPRKVDRVISTFALTLVPEFETVIARAREALMPDGKLVLLDFKKPERASEALTKVMVAATRPFAVTLDLAARHPWETVQRTFQNCRFQNLYFGFAYIVSGWAPDERPGRT